MATAAERCPPPVSDEMIRILGTLARNMSFGFDRQTFCPRLVALELFARLLHLALQTLDLDEVLRVERERRVIAVRLVRAEAPGLSFLAPLLHGGREPEFLEVPIVIAQIADRVEVLARGDGALVVDDPARRAGVAGHLRLLLLLGARDQAVHVDVDGGLEETGVASVIVLDRRVARIGIDHVREFGVAPVVDVEFLGVGRGRADVVEVDFVGAQVILEKIVPFEDGVLIRVHEAGAGLDVEARVLALDRLQLARGVDGDVPRAGLLADLLVLVFEAVDAEGDRHVQVRALFQNSRHVRDDALLDLPVRHEINRFELVVLVEGADDFRQVLARERFAPGEDEDAEVAAERLGDALNFVRLHLKFLARAVVELVSKEAMRAAHIAN